MRKSNEQSLGEVISQWIKEWKLENKITEVRIHAAWEKVMGQQIHSLTDKVTFSDQKLTIFLRSAPLREELSLAKTKIIDLINKEVGQTAIKELHLR